MNKDGEDSCRLQTTNLKILGVLDLTYEEVQSVTQLLEF